MLEYVDVETDLTVDRRILLLGNGFSIAYEAAFRYDSLWDHARAQGLLGDRVNSVAKELDTKNFEDVILFLERAERTAREYGAREEAVFDRMQEDAQALRKALVGAISKIHLQPRTEFSRREVTSCVLFLSSYSDIFTTNYDLLLYWMLQNGSKLLISGETGGPKRNFVDGFCVTIDAERLAFKPQVLLEAENGIHFLHGALHIGHEGNDAWKYRATREKTVKKLIIEGVERGNLPLVVAEGKSAAKQAKIDASAYLKTCLRKLRGAGGALVTFGFAFNQQDRHIMNAIADNPKISRVFVGVRPTASGAAPESVQNGVKYLLGARGIAQLLEPTMPDLSVEYFDASTAFPWDSPHLRDDHPFWERRPRTPK